MAYGRWELINYNWVFKTQRCQQRLPEIKVGLEIFFLEIMASESKESGSCVERCLEVQS